MSTNNEVLPILTGSIAASFSLLVVVTLLFFPSIMRNRVFVKIVLQISVSNCLSEVCYAFGYPTNPSFCQAQGILINFFARSSIFWTTILSGSLYTSGKNRF